MSKIGQKPILINSGVTVTIDKNDVTIKGPKGELVYFVPRELGLTLTDTELLVEKKSPVRQASALWGLWRSILANAVEGVEKTFVRKLELVGVGYRVAMKGKDLELQVGFSHPVLYTAPEGIAFEVEGQIVSVSGIDKQKVGQIAAEIRAVRPPEPYKGKGIKYVGEVIRRKAGKAAKAAA